MKKVFSIYPFIIALYPPINLYIKNIEKVPFLNVVGAVFVIIFFVFLMNRLHKSIFRDEHRAAIFSTIFFILFFSFGKIMIGLYLGIITVIHLDVNSHISKWMFPSESNQIVLFIFETILLISTGFLVRKCDTRFVNIVNQAFCFIGVILGLSLVIDSGYQLATKTSTRNKLNDKRLQVDLPQKKIHNPSTLPNIYYIILDEYGGSDMLHEKYQYDNSQFIHQLGELGFYIANNSHSNYDSTMASIGATLNLDYYSELCGSSNPADYTTINWLINNNLTFEKLTHLGYEIININSGLGFSHFERESRNYSPGNISFLYNTYLLQTTPLILIENDISYDIYRDRINYVLESSENLKTPSDHPSFVFIHVLSPHTPFVFGENGEKNNQNSQLFIDDRTYIALSQEGEWYRESYRYQITYITSRALDIVKNILSTSTRPTIIILQGDHGPRSEPNDMDEKFSILNAYYFPQRDYSTLYSTISPVNSFRVVFNQYMGENYVLLPDASWICKESDLIDCKNMSAQLK
jgi:hypothetical protein